MDKRGLGPDGHLPEDHSWAWELLGPYVLGGLDLEEEKRVGWHIAWCAACQEEERGLRETHERLSAASIAAASAPSYLKAHVFSALPARDGSETPSEVRRASFRFTWRVGRMMMVAAMVFLMVALPAMAFSSGLLDQGTTVALKPTELASGAGGGVDVQGSGRNVQANLDVWGLPPTGQDEYYELWFSNDGKRVSAGTFKVDPKGQAKLYGNVPELPSSYKHVDVTLEKPSEEPGSSSAKAMLNGDLSQS
ncbi:MAG: anti-sigma factor [Rubrobacter sp.]|nr:anti-sigma factor [Rubrobacter sp.]